MKAFLSHSSLDKDVVAPIASRLLDLGVDVWLDSWRMTPGDSLVERIGEGIETSDRLVVFLSQASVASNWVQKEVATGIVMELAENRGLTDKFVIPALLTQCKIPILLREKLYANFTNKSIEAACAELYTGLVDKPAAPFATKLENRVLRQTAIENSSFGRHALILEFGVRLSPTEGLHIGVEVGHGYEQAVGWFSLPNNPIPPSTRISATYSDYSERKRPTTYEQRFSAPGLSSSKSYYLLLGGAQPIAAVGIRFLDYYGRKP